MWEYNYRVASNELYHHGVKGMKWGVRKSSSGGRSGGGSSKIKKFAVKQAKKYVQKQGEKTKQLHESVDRYGVIGVAVGKYLGYTGTHALRAGLANVINMSANAYISANSSKYHIARGVDFVRRASISYLSIRDSAEKINAVADVGRAAIYKHNKKQNKG